MPNILTLLDITAWLAESLHTRGSRGSHTHTHVDSTKTVWRKVSRVSGPIRGPVIQSVVKLIVNYIWSISLSARAAKTLSTSTSLSFSFSFPLPPLSSSPLELSERSPSKQGHCTAIWLGEMELCACPWERNSDRENDLLEITACSYLYSAHKSKKWGQSSSMFCLIRLVGRTKVGCISDSSEKKTKNARLSLRIPLMLMVCVRSVFVPCELLFSCLPYFFTSDFLRPAGRNER